MSRLDLDTRTEELQIEIERLKAWLDKIQHEAWKETSVHIIEALAEDAIRYRNCAAQPDWPRGHDWAKIGKWPPKVVNRK